MVVPFKDIDEQINYIKVLLREMGADNNYDYMELGYALRLIKKRGINPDLFPRAEREFIVKKDIKPFNSMAKTMIAIYDAISLAAINTELNVSEISELIRIAHSLGLKNDSDEMNEINEYTNDFVLNYVKLNKEYHELIGQIVNPDKLNNLKELFSNINDTRNCLQAVARIAFADNMLKVGEIKFTELLFGSFNLGDSMLDYTIGDFRDTKDTVLKFTNETCARATIALCIRIAISDFMFDDSEKHVILQIAGQIGVDISRDLLDSIDKVDRQIFDNNKTRIKAMGRWEMLI